MKISQREKWMLVVLGAFFCGIAIVVLLLLPALDRREKLERLISAQEEQVNRINALSENWQRISRTRNEVLSKIEARGKDFALFSYLETLAGEAGLKSAIQYMRPLTFPQGDAREGFVKRGIEVRLKEVEIVNLVKYLYSIEYSEKMLKVEYVHVKPLYTDPRYLNTTLRIVTYDLA